VTSVRKRLARLTDGLLFEVTSALALAHQIRPHPSLIQRWRDKMESALIEAMLIGQHEARLAEDEQAEVELADTRPLKTQPPPKPKA
jgi:xanthine/CO dehydrogenase XdhC/CoxF family maturation factor